MARPFKARRVCSQPMVEVFGPLDQDAATRVELTLEEYETIRLIDLLDCTQEECAGQMGVARTTVQAVYNSARKKLADCLVNEMCIRDSAYIFHDRRIRGHRDRPGQADGSGGKGKGEK